MSNVSAVSSNSAAATSAVDQSMSLLDEEAFLTMLVAELENQDPLDPMTNQEFIGQLADLSSLEQLQNLADLTETGLIYDQTSINAQSLSLIGKDVLAYDSTIEYGGSGTVDMSTEVDVATDITYKIYDEDGNVIRTVYLGEVSGKVEFSWDGKTDSGADAGEGTYGVTVQSGLESGSEQFPVYFKGTVIGVDFSNGTVALTLDTGQTVEMGGVVSILANNEGGDVIVTEPED